MNEWPFGDLPRRHYRAVLADPPWVFNSLWGGRPKKIGNNYPSRAVERHYDLQEDVDIAALPVAELAAPDCVLFMWTCWPVLRRSLAIIDTEPCLLATRGKPKRLAADVRQGIIAPRREHSRKPEGIHPRIERLVAGPYVELFARQKRAGWDSWGNETGKFAEVA